MLVVIVIPSSFADWLAFWTDEPPKEWLGSRVPEAPWEEVFRWGVVALGFVLLILIWRREQPTPTQDDTESKPPSMLHSTDGARSEIQELIARIAENSVTVEEDGEPVPFTEVFAAIVPELESGVAIHSLGDALDNAVGAGRWRAHVEDIVSLLRKYDLVTEQLVTAGVVPEARLSLSSRGARVAGDPAIREATLRRVRDRAARAERERKIYRDEAMGLRQDAEWARERIGRERETPFLYLQYEPWITNTTHLDDANPYFDIVIVIRYGGLLTLHVGEKAEGRLRWHGEAFAERPDFKGDMGGPLPLSVIGPNGGGFRIRQYVRDAVAAQLREVLKPGHEVEFTHDLHVSLRMETFNGQSVYDGDFPFGEYITIHLRQ